jgi:hypothetical protein
MLHKNMNEKTAMFNNKLLYVYARIFATVTFALLCCGLVSCGSQTEKPTDQIKQPQNVNNQPVNQPVQSDYKDDDKQKKQYKNQPSQQPNQVDKDDDDQEDSKEDKD